MRLEVYAFSFLDDSLPANFSQRKWKVGMKDNEECVVEIVLPVHNEGSSIASTLREIYKQVTDKDGIRVRFILSEDGSSDNTVDELRNLENTLPMHIISSLKRKGYSRAVIDGIYASEGEVVVFMDSDGQYDPEDFGRLHRALGSNDIVVGCRSPRSDHWARILMSKAIGIFFWIVCGISTQSTV